jgi:acyl dehydratase
MFAGDTLYAESTVLNKRESKNRRSPILSSAMSSPQPRRQCT